MDAFHAAADGIASGKYSYDDAGHVLSMANRPVDGDNKPRAGDEDVQCFGYDHLRRLTRSWAQQASTCGTPSAGTVGGKAPYRKPWTFDQHGSREAATDHVSGTTSTYTYGAGHQLRTVATGDQVDHYDYDERGNLEYRNRILRWIG